MPVRRLSVSALEVLALLLVGFLLAPASSAGGGDPAADKLASEWSKSDDAARAALVEAALATPSKPVLDAILQAARTSLGVRKEADRLRKSFAAHRKELGDDVKDDDPRLARDRAEVDNLAQQAERETAAVKKLAPAVGRVLDALPEGDATLAIKDLLRTAPDPALEGFRGFVGEGIGASRLQRTTPPLIETPAEARKEIVKLQKERAEPARKLEDVIAKLNDAVDRYLKAARAKGDNSGMVPVGLLGTYPDQKDELDKVVTRLGNAIEAADERRRTALEALGRILGGMGPADAGHVIDIVENRLLRDDDVENRSFGYLAIGPAQGARALQILSAAADGKDPRDAAAALEALGDRPEPEAVALLRKHLADEAADWRVRTSAAGSLARLGKATSVPPLIEAMKTAKGRLLDDLREGLASLTGQTFPAVEAPWRTWWDIAGKDFLGPKDPKPATAPSPPAGGGADGKPPAATAAVAKGEDGFQFYGIESHSTRVLFILDYSGSMLWAGSGRDEKVKKIDILRAEMKKSLAGLPDGSTFNVLAFSSDVRPWKKEPQIRSVKTAAEALLWVEKAPVDGGTNIGDALETGFKLMGAGLQKDKNEAPAFDTVFFMTDGKPSVGKVTDTRQILGAVRRWNDGRKVRIHVVGMGGHKKADDPAGGPAKPGKGGKDKEDDMDEDFLKALAAQNGGQCVIH